MKKILILSAALLFGQALSTKASNDPVKVDTKKSVVRWTGEKLTGEHYGTIAIKSGSVSVSNGIITAAEINMDMNSIVNEDLTDPGTNAKLVGHLKSEDFFNVSEYAVSTFKLTGFTPQKGENTNYLVTGTLTIKGITQPISFPASVDVRDGFVRAKADLTFDRAKYNVRYGSSSFFDGLGDAVIYDDVKISFELIATAQ